MTTPPGGSAHEGVPWPLRRSPHGERRNMAPAARPETPVPRLAAVHYPERTRDGSAYRTCHYQAGAMLWLTRNMFAGSSPVDGIPLCDFDAR